MIVIGMVGPFGSGCTYVRNIICDHYGYQPISLSTLLRDEYLAEHPEADSSESKRIQLQDYGNEMRAKHGGEVLARLAYEKYIKDCLDNENGTGSEYGTGFVIDSIRNPCEVEYLKRVIPNFYLVGIFADGDVRYSRVRHIYDDDRRSFDADDTRDKGEKDVLGQQVTNAFKLADYIILNNEKIIHNNANKKILLQKVLDAVDVMRGTIPFLPKADETYMAMAYAASMRSSCLKRKVGAIIIDGSGAVISSGYNEVPSSQYSCSEQYDGCYRDNLKQDFKLSLDRETSNSKDSETAYNLFKKTFKILDYCRALHAEENAIVSVARTGAAKMLDQATLYTTTYPCNLCANKIAEVGISQLVYFEPYPMQDAKEIIKNSKIEQRPFEGVTFNGYFKFMEVVN